jgi:hypothetical protein
MFLFEVVRDLVGPCVRKWTILLVTLAKSSK